MSGTTQGSRETVLVGDCDWHASDSYPFAIAIDFSVRKQFFDSQQPSPVDPRPAIRTLDELSSIRVYAHSPHGNVARLVFRNGRPPIEIASSSCRQFEVWYGFRTPGFFRRRHPNLFGWLRMDCAIPGGGTLKGELSSFDCYP